MLTHAGVFSVDFSRIDTGKTVCFLVSGGLFGAGISVCQRTCTAAHIGGRRAGSMCPAAQGDTDPPCLPPRGRWQREALAEGVCWGGRLCPLNQREALSFRASANTGVGIRLPLPPSAREVAARSAGGGRDSTRFSLPQSAAPTAPSQRGPRSAAPPR